MSDLGESGIESNPVEWPFPEIRTDPGGCLWPSILFVAAGLIAFLSVAANFVGCQQP